MRELRRVRPGTDRGDQHDEEEQTHNDDGADERAAFATG